MIVRTLFLALAALSTAAGTALAAERMAYEPKAFARALEEGRPVLVHVTAPRCGECRAQKPIVAALADTPAFKGLTIVDVDYDTQKDVLRELKVQKQSTLVVFRNRIEAARAVGITRPQAIESLMRKAL